MKIEYSKFILTPKKRLNNFSSTSKKYGVYLKINEKYFLEYFPWDFFGDKTINDFLDDLKKNGLPCFLFSLLDLEKEKESIKHIPFKNHNDDEFFKKIKVFNLEDIFHQLSNASEGIRFRFDFNNKWEMNDIISIWDSLDEVHKAKIDYFEDPCPNIKEEWKLLYKIGVPLACDRNPKESTYYDFEIFKPNCEEYKKNDRAQIFSSYMGGDLGRYHCYLAYCVHGDRSLIHGIHTPDIYEEQIELFKTHDNQFIVSDKIIDLYKNLYDLEWTVL